MMRVGAPEWRSLIAQGAESMGIGVDARQMERFSVHAEQLLAWTKKSNLTAITDPEEIAVKHFIDSLAPNAWIDPTGSLLDIGSGGGFPGIPLKILMPELNLTLIDASRKKISFLNHLIRMLELSPARAVHVRAEDLALNQEAAESFDAIISRALGPLDEFVQMAVPLLKPDGIMIAMKGRVGPNEVESVRRIRLAGPTPERQPASIFIEVHPYKLPFADAHRSIICMTQKRSSTAEFENDKPFGTAEDKGSNLTSME